MRCSEVGAELWGTGRGSGSNPFTRSAGAVLAKLARAGVVRRTFKGTHAVYAACKTLLVAALAAAAAGCADDPASSRQVVVNVMGTAEVQKVEQALGWQYVGRDTNGAVWLVNVSGGAIVGKTQLFDAPK